MNTARQAIGIVLSAAFWTIFHATATPALSLLLFPKYYGTLLRKWGAPKPKDQEDALRKLTDWDSKFPTFVHAIIATLLSTYCCFMDEGIVKDELRGTSEAWQATVSCTAGFFIWDLYIHIRHYSLLGWAMLLHAVLGLTTFLICGLSDDMPCAWYCCTMLLFEFSTPFMIIRWIAIKLKSSARTINVLTQLFGVTFFACRIVWGDFIAFPKVWAMLIDRPEKMSYLKAGVFWVMTVASFSLNNYWMYRLGRRIFMKPETPKPAGETNKNE